MNASREIEAETKRTEARVSIGVFKDGWTGGLQLSIDDECGGFRLCGPKFNGSSKPILEFVISSEHEIEEIRRYLRKAARLVRARTALTRAQGSQR